MTDPFKPDPGNAPPEEWSEPLDPAEQDLVLEQINQTSVATPYRDDKESDDSDD